jgi:hypothetical protein
MLFRVAVSLGLLVAIVAVALPSFVAVNRKDLAAPNDSDLGVAAQDSAAGAAGLEAVRHAAAILGEPGHEQHSEAVAALAGVEVVDLAGVPEDEIPELHGALHRILALSGEAARSAAAAGRTDAALEDAGLGMRLGRAVSRGRGGVVAMMVAASLQARALGDLESVVRESQLPPDRARSLAVALEESRWKTEDWFRAWAFEYQHLKTTLLAVDLEAELRQASEGEGFESQAYGWLPSSYLWQPNRTLSETASIYRERQQRSSRACAPRAQVERTPRFGIPAALAPNAVGQVLLEVAQPDFERFDAKRCHLETRIALLQALAGAKAHWHEYGMLPRSLTEVVPDVLPAMPVDAFRDAPLRYSAEARRVWSLGSDFEAGPADAAADPADASEPALSLDFG